MENQNDENKEPLYDWEGLRQKLVDDGCIRHETMTVTLPRRDDNPRPMSNTCDSIYPVRTDTKTFYQSKMKTFYQSIWAEGGKK
jgi:hypothetical protein